MSTHRIRTAHRAVTRATTLVALAVYLFALFVGAMGPGGFFMGVEPPQDRGGMTLPAIPQRLTDTCVTPEEHPEGVVPARVVVVEQNRDVHAMGFGKAWAINTDDNRANDVYVIGMCQ